MSLPNDPALVASIQDLLNTLDLHRPAADRADHPAAHEFLDAVEAHFKMVQGQIATPEKK
jgi:hypothetical protein